MCPGYRGHLWDADLAEGFVIEVAGTSLRVLHTPGHAPGAVCLNARDLGCVFTDDTLFHGGPGATGRSYSDKPTLESSIRAKLFTLPDETVVHTGHGQNTTLAAERALLAAEPIRPRVRRLPGEECVPVLPCGVTVFAPAAHSGVGDRHIVFAFR